MSGFENKERTLPTEVFIPDMSLENKQTLISTASFVQDKIENISDTVEDMDLSYLTDKIGKKKKKENFGMGDCSEVEELSLSREKDISDIKNFKSLKKLELYNCNLTREDLEALPDTIETLTISVASAEDLKALSHLKNLKELKINYIEGDINLSDLDLENLKSLKISVAENITGNIDKLKSLEELEICGTCLDSVEFLRGNKTLKSLNIGGNFITDISPLYDSNLEKLLIANNAVSEVDLSRFPKLNSFSFAGNYNLYTKEMLDYLEKNIEFYDLNEYSVEEMDQVREIVNSLDLEGKTDLEKEKIIYDYVIKNMKYKKSKKQESNADPIGTALEGQAVCVSYAHLFKALCDVAGIHAYVSEGTATEIGIGGGLHAWNMVEIDGQYYLCDPTWSDQIRQGKFYDPRRWVYSTRSLWHKLFNKDGFPVDDVYFNRYGKKTKLFQFQHRENNSEHRDLDDRIEKNEKAAQTNQSESPVAEGDVFEVNTDTEEGVQAAINTVIASIIRESGIRSISNEIVDKIFKN